MEQVRIGIQELLEGEQILLRNDQDIIRDAELLQSICTTVCVNANMMKR